MTKLGVKTVQIVTSLFISSLFILQTHSQIVEINTDGALGTLATVVSRCTDACAMTPNGPYPYPLLLGLKGSRATTVNTSLIPHGAWMGAVGYGNCEQWTSNNPCTYGKTRDSYASCDTILPMYCVCGNQTSTITTSPTIAPTSPTYLQITDVVFGESGSACMSLTNGVTYCRNGDTMPFTRFLHAQPMYMLATGGTKFTLHVNSTFTLTPDQTIATCEREILDSCVIHANGTSTCSPSILGYMGCSGQNYTCISGENDGIVQCAYEQDLSTTTMTIQYPEQLLCGSTYACALKDGSISCSQHQNETHFEWQGTNQIAVAGNHVCMLRRDINATCVHLPSFTQKGLPDSFAYADRLLGTPDDAQVCAFFYNSHVECVQDLMAETYTTHNLSLRFPK